MTNDVQIDAHPPAKMAIRMKEVGVTKAGLKGETTFALAMPAGAFIGCGASLATTVTTGLVFCLGLMAVIVAGAELFAGSDPIVIAFANGRVPLNGLLRNWATVYLGNFVGSILAFLAMFLTRQYTSAGGALGAYAPGIVCNALVCLAMWLCLSARSTANKIPAINLPIAAFVAAGLEYSAANMCFIPIGLPIVEKGKKHAQDPDCRR